MTEQSGDQSADSRAFNTRVVHSGERATGDASVPTSTPIYPSSSFIQPTIAQLDGVLGGFEPGYVYTRYGNPTTRAFEEAIANLEGTDTAIAFSSGMAALHAAILNEVKAGSKIVASTDIYGATAAMLTRVFDSLDVETVFVDATDLTRLESTVQDVKPRAVLVETISNPLLKVTDLPAVVEIAHSNKATVVCDSTFASPVLVRPAEFGVDTVVHSTTKYLSGHGDVTGGIVATDVERGFEIVELTKLVGGIPGPFESWLSLRGLKTLSLRMRQHSENACAIANFLASHPSVEKVLYPGFGAGPAGRIFATEQRGGMVSIEIANAGRDEVFRFLEALQIFLPVTSLGDVYSLALYPPISSHRGLDDEELEAAGIRPGLVRLSIGIEDAADLQADLDQALAKAVS